VVSVALQDLASGYVLGEIFYRCHMQPDFDKFVDRTHPDAMINNFTRLQPTVTKLGIPFDSVLANSMMTEERGVATKFLYTLKTVLDRMTKEMHDSKNAGAFAHTIVRISARTETHSTQTCLRECSWECSWARDRDM